LIIAVGGLLVLAGCDDDIPCPGSKTVYTASSGETVKIRVNIYPEQGELPGEAELEAFLLEHFKDKYKCDCSDGRTCELRVDVEGAASWDLINHDKPYTPVYLIIEAGEDGGSVTLYCEEVETAGLYSGTCEDRQVASGVGEGAPVVACSYDSGGSLQWCASDVRPGDVDGDGADWDDWDALAGLIDGSLSVGIVACPAAADVDGDGMVTQADLLALEAMLWWEDWSAAHRVSCLPAPLPDADACPFAAEDSARGCGEAFVRGDANDDGVVGLADAMATLQWLFQGGAPVCGEAADFDKNGEVAMNDAVALLQYLYQGGAPAAAPATTPGPSCRASCMFDYSDAPCGAELEARFDEGA
jgi:hypothetical protein